MENHNWSQVEGSSSAPFINGTLLKQGAHATNYFNPPGIHPSEPNYIWLEAGSNLGVRSDALPSSSHQSTTHHLTTLLDAKGVTWKSYQEDISGRNCPLTNVAKYAPKHNPMVFFDDVTGTNNPSSQTCIAHIRPFSELAGDLSGGRAAAYNFITPNLCDDMHDNCTGDEVQQGDDWLATTVPMIMASSAYQNGGAIFITWDEGEGGDGPIGMIVLSPSTTAGRTVSTHFDHSSMLKTAQEIFGVTPLLGGAASATDLAALLH
jgi:phospholipase C